jgi:recombination protein RecA
MNKEAEKLLAKAQAKFGENAVMFCSDMPTRPPISSGSIALDFATGFGGFPQDRVIEIVGNEGAGKTTLGLLAMASFLDAQPDRCALILDTEHKLTKGWIEQLIGTERMSRVLVAWPDHAEQATDLYMELVSSGQVCFCLFDSVGGTPTKRGAEESAENKEYGGNAKDMSRFARLAAGHSDKYCCLTVCVNQVREDFTGRHILVTPGGKALKHAYVMRIKLARGDERFFEKIDNEPLQVGYNIVAKIVKNQVGAPGRTATWKFYNVPTDKYGFGIDTADELVRLAVITNVIDRRGAWYYHAALPGGKVQSAAGLMDLLNGDPALKETVISETMAVLASRRELIGEIAPMSENPEDDLNDAEVARMGRDWTATDAN